MQQIAPASSELYILGDLFEVWIGDDSIDAALPDSEIYRQSIQLIRDYSETHGSVFLMHGNRDFLLGKQFAQLSGCEILAEPSLIKPFDKKIALLHGDSLCTDDSDYQAFKKMVRDSQWQQNFLNLDLDKRIEIASGLRQQSQQQQKQKSMAIMDVNQSAVVEFIQDQRVDILIHGHTHRQQTHRVNTASGKALRIVLSDWGQQGFYLSLNEQGFSENYFEL